MYVRTGASSYAAPVLFGVAGSSLLSKVWDNVYEGSALQHALPCVGVYDSVLQTDEFSLLALLRRPPSRNDFPREDVAFPTGTANPGSRNRCRITRLDRQGSAPKADPVCVGMMEQPCCTRVHLGTDIQKSM